MKLFKRTRPTMTTSFDSSQICRIIEVCSLSGVARFSCAGLELSFLQVDKAPTTEPVFVRPETQAKQDSQARDSRTQEEFTMKQSQLEQMLIDDPLEYENLMRTRDIVE